MGEEKGITSKTITFVLGPDESHRGSLPAECQINKGNDVMKKKKMIAQTVLYSMSLLPLQAFPNLSVASNYTISSGDISESSVSDFIDKSQPSQTGVSITQYPMVETSAITMIDLSLGLVFHPAFVLNLVPGFHSALGYHHTFLLSSSSEVFSQKENVVVEDVNETEATAQKIAFPTSITGTERVSGYLQSVEFQMLWAKPIRLFDSTGWSLQPMGSIELGAGILQVTQSWALQSEVTALNLVSGQSNYTYSGAYQYSASNLPAFFTRVRAGVRFPVSSSVKADFLLGYQLIVSGGAFDLNGSATVSRTDSSGSTTIRNSFRIDPADQALSSSFGGSGFSFGLRAEINLEFQNDAPENQSVKVYEK